MTRPRGKPGSSAATTYVALLRGVNVGGKNLLPMAALAEIFSAAGCGDVRTYIQSGNVVFCAPDETARRIPSLVAKAIAERFGLRTPVVLRSSAEWRRIARGNPFVKTGAEPQWLHVAFLADLPDPSRRSALDPRRSPGDFFELRGRELYLHLPNGAGRTKLTNAYIDATLGTTSTLRNWRTVLKLLEMTS